MLRDPKGLYKKALAGEIGLFTGISAPYDIPANPEIVIDTNGHTAEDCAASIYQFYRGRRSDA
jgi:adenylylsulfate kinase